MDAYASDRLLVAVERIASELTTLREMYANDMANRQETNAQAKAAMSEMQQALGGGIPAVFGRILGRPAAQPEEPSPTGMTVEEIESLAEQIKSKQTP